MPIHEVEDCPTWGNLALLLAGGKGRPPGPSPTYHAARLLTRQWAQPDTDKPQAVYRATSSLRTRLGLPLVTAYAVHRPDGRWSVLLLNKDPKRAHPVTVRFGRAPGAAPLSFSGPADLYQYSAAQYAWHPHQARGFAAPDSPPRHSRTSRYTILLPPFSLSLLRGQVVGLP